MKETFVLISREQVSILTRIGGGEIKENCWNICYDALVSP